MLAVGVKIILAVCIAYSIGVGVAQPQEREGESHLREDHQYGQQELFGCPFFDGQRKQQDEDGDRSQGPQDEVVEQPQVLRLTV